MATIGTFKKTGDNEITAEIVILSLHAKDVRIVSESNRSGPNAATATTDTSSRQWTTAAMAQTGSAS